MPRGPKIWNEIHVPVGKALLCMISNSYTPRILIQYPVFSWSSSHIAGFPSSQPVFDSGQRFEAALSKRLLHLQGLSPPSCSPPNGASDVTCICQICYVYLSNLSSVFVKVVQCISRLVSGFCIWKSFPLLHSSSQWVGRSNDASVARLCRHDSGHSTPDVVKHGG